MPRCSVCHHRVTRGEQACPICGEPVARVSRGGPKPAVGARVISRPRLSRRRPRLIAGGVLLVGLSVTGVFVIHGRSGSTGPPDAAYSVARLASDPGARWQRPLGEVAPGLRCGSASATNDPGNDVCTVVDSAVTTAAAVVVVRKGARSELVGLARENGTVRWRRTAPAGSSYRCLTVEGRLWCLTTPAPGSAFFAVARRGESQAGAMPQVAGGYRGSTLTEVRPETGATVRSTKVPGSQRSAQFGGIGRRGLYVIAGSTATGTTVLRYSDRGALQWSRSVTVTADIVRIPDFGGVPPVRVIEQAGKSYVSAAQIGDRQTVFTTKSGAPVAAGVGHVASLVGAQIVTQVGSGALLVDGTPLRDNRLADLAADDRSDGEPLLTAHFTDSGAQFPALSPAAIRTPTAPDPALAMMKVEDSPTAFCGGVVIGHALRAVSGYDGRTGRRLWGVGLDEGSSLQILCDRSKVVVADGTRVTAYAVRDGAQKWSVPLPKGSRLSVDGFGDSASALLAVPSELDLGASPASITLVQ